MAKRLHGVLEEFLLVVHVGGSLGRELCAERTIARHDLFRRGFCVDAQYFIERFLHFFFSLVLLPRKAYTTRLVGVKSRKTYMVRASSATSKGKEWGRPTGPVSVRRMRRRSQCLASKMRW